MSYEASATEVAEDYRQALEDLTTNVRFEISNLTMIAREQTEHAQVIAEVLQKHILRAPPHKKLPALYVLDSIVKNVGTPYTLFFGAKLFTTFMEAYAAVDGQVRRKMDEMLRTWKEPVPGSLDKRPVFPAEVTQPIESALMKARTSALQAQQQQGHGRGRPGAPYRETPTPPGVRPGLNQPTGPYGQPPLQQPNGNRPPSAPLPHHPQMAPYAPSPASYSAQPPPAASGPYHPPPQMPHAAGLAGPPAGGISRDSLGQDIQKLIDSSKLEFAQNPHDHSIQQRLKALLDVQSLLQHQNLPQDQLVLIKNQVADLAVKVRPFSAQGSAPAATPVPHHPPPAAAAPVVPSPGPSSQQASVTLDSLFGQGALSALLQRQSATPQAPAPAPTPPYAHMAIRSPPPQRAEPQRQPSAPPATDPMALLAGLRQAGLLSGATRTATSTPPAPIPAMAPTPAAAPAPPPGMPMLSHGLLPPNIASLLAGMKRPPPAGVDVNGLDATALKQQCQPHSISSLFEHLGPQCTQCGRRFKTDEEGRKKKMAHMDWHFKAHQRLAEAEKRGQHRSWYVDNNDWLKSREAIDVDHVSSADNSSSSPGRERKEAKPRYIPVPDASSGINSVCPICQEKFENKWLDTAQEWVWLDTTLVGNRAYHYSCHAEATHARESTPEPVLGKRKAEVSMPRT
ncbi:mRNA cleavage factor complex component pcf11 [Colletotrichum sojae]|uniref:mRNA cleavage factor complex component pcf11 n=1 Tax=Colletotrichum sojae TaxID=2175907 RepID=A0A8H6N6D1_9PEZI|nr:mRNA cleavage factor complex component pcf11 [Colletotrichum sojae]